MIVYSVETDLNQKEIIEQANAYFAEELGLEAEDKGACCAYFNDPNSVGYVSVRLEGEDAKKLTVRLETREYKFQVKKFMEQIS
jgi:hypothetical protein